MERGFIQGNGSANIVTCWLYQNFQTRAGWILAWEHRCQSLLCQLLQHWQRPQPHVWSLLLGSLVWHGSFRLWRDVHQELRSRTGRGHLDSGMYNRRWPSLLQLFFNDTIPDAELPTHWPDMKPGLEHWTIYDNLNGNQDECYTAPFAYQNRYWISYDDEYSTGLKARYANHYGLKGTLVWEVDSDNFRGLFNSKPFTILKALNHAAVSGLGLSDDENLGHGNENLGWCDPEAPMCFL